MMDQNIQDGRTVLEECPKLLFECNYDKNIVPPDEYKAKSDVKV